jgi:Uma2 family endonuclease
MKMAVYPYSTEVSEVDGPPQGQWTYADWEKLPDDGNIYEVIDGVLYVSKAPGIPHETILLNLYDAVGYPARQQKLARIYLANAGVLMPGCEPVQPDFIVVLEEHASIVKERGVSGVPDLLGEILSPSTKKYDETVKLKVYARCGVPEYVVIDPEQRQLRLYTLKALGDYGEPRTFNEGDTVTFACLPTIAVAVRMLFEGAPDTTV